MNALCTDSRGFVTTIQLTKPPYATRTLIGMSETERYRTLNGRVLLWLHMARLARLRNSPAYRDRQHDLLVLSTAKLLDRHANVVELSPLNSGAVHPRPTTPAAQAP